MHQQEALLEYRREEALAEVWGDATEKCARENLRQSVQGIVAIALCNLYTRGFII